MEHMKCLIIGAGPAGYTAAIYAARAGMEPVMLTGMQPGGQLMITNEVENYPGYPNGTMGPQMMEDLKKQAERFGTVIKYETVMKVDFSGPVHRVWNEDNTEYQALTIIIATGASAKWTGLKDEERLQNKGVSACAVCDGFFFKNQEVAVIGGGDTAAEEATYLAKMCKKVHLLVRRDEMRASQIMQKRVLNTPNLEIHWNTSPVELLGDDLLEGVRLKNNVTGEESTIAVTGFFVAIGHDPNTKFLKNILNLDENGYIKTIPGTSKTELAGVFACGDAQDHVYRQAVTAAGTGCMAALDAERYVATIEDL
jgi:thioredoxin reductase (NADPH)